jgi:anti-sigma regulatory factor (Ser/Thr protein kinase)
MQREEAHAAPRRLQVTLPPDADAPAAARRALRSLPLGEREDDVLLLATELVSNAVVHAHAAMSQPIELSAACERGRTHVEVRCQDDGAVAAELSNGYGLRLLAGATERWGIERDGITLVWFELGQ